MRPSGEKAVRMRALLRAWLILVLALEVLVLSVLAFESGPSIDVGSLRLLSWIAITLLTTHLALIAYLPGVGVVSIPFIYAASAGLYMVSPLILYLALGPLGLIYFRFIDYGYLTGSVPLIMLAIVSFVLGATIPSISSRNQPTINRDVSNSAHQRIEVMTSVVALSLVLVSLIAIAAETAVGRGLAPMLTGSYHLYSDMRKDGDQSRLYVAATTWFLPIAALTYNAMRKARLRRIGASDLLFFALLIIPLMTGDRGHLIATFAGWLIIHQAICGNVSIWKLGMAAVALMVLIPLLEVIRSLAAASWSPGLIIETLRVLLSSNERFGDSVLMSILGPFSPSLMTLMGTLMRVDSGENLRLGLDYMNNLLAAIPFNSSMAPDNSDQIHKYLVPRRRGGPGFMAIAEMYLNFHILGVIAGHVLLGWVTMSMHRRLQGPGPSAHTLAFAAVFFFTLLIWIRNEFDFVAQVCFLWWLFFWLIPRLGKGMVPWKGNRSA